MVTIKTFTGYRPRKNLVDKVASPPYDVLSSEEAREMAVENNMSFLHVVKPEIDFPEDTDLYSEKVYLKGAENLKRLINDGVLIKDKEPSFYIYSQKMGDHFQAGIVALASAEEYLSDKIKKHEHTKPDKVNDRTNHINTQGAHSGPVFLLYRNRESINRIVEKTKERKPDANMIAPDGVAHMLWIISDKSDMKTLSEEFGKIDVLYIADGHHRSASAVENYTRDRTKATAFFLAVLFPDNQLKIMAYNRVVKDLNGLSEEEFFNKLSEKFDIIQNANPVPELKHTVSMYINNKWFSLRMKPEIINENDPVKRLDVSILQINLLDPVLGIRDPKTDKRIDFIGGIRGIKELERLVNNGSFKVAFSMYPLEIDDLMNIADAGEVMPPKSTWFEPKLRSGMVVNVFR